MKKKSGLVICLLLLVISGPSFVYGQANGPEKNALVILGDFWHAVAPLNRAIVYQLKDKGYDPDIILDYNVPFDRLSDYDLVVLSRYAVDDFRSLKENVTDPRTHAWITPAQEDALEKYVLEGGNIFFHHDGIGFYPRGGGISRLAKAYFITHPAVTTITVVPVGEYDGLNVDVVPFIISDEEYEVEMDPSSTHVFLQSFSDKYGQAYQGWAHDYGDGKVVVYVPGHDRYSLAHPMVLKSISNILDSFSR